MSESFDHSTVVTHVPWSFGPMFSAPQRIKTAPRQPDKSLLLFCPEQGGWHTGEWVAVTGDWRSVISWDHPLEPTHWMSVPSEPFDA